MCGKCGCHYHEQITSQVNCQVAKKSGWRPRALQRGLPEKGTAGTGCLAGASWGPGHHGQLGDTAVTDIKRVPGPWGSKPPASSLLAQMGGGPRRSHSGCAGGRADGAASTRGAGGVESRVVGSAPSWVPTPCAPSPPFTPLPCCAGPRGSLPWQPVQ